MHALTRDKSVCAYASRFSNRAMQFRIIPRSSRSVVTAPNSAMTSHMGRAVTIFVADAP